MQGIEGIYYGADISGGGGSGATHVECDYLGKNYYTLAEVDEQGVVVNDSDGGLQRLTVTDLNTEGVRIFVSGRDNSVVEPGEKLPVTVGSHTVTITATAAKGVIFNGEEPKRLTNDLEHTRYPGQYESDI